MAFGDCNFGKASVMIPMETQSGFVWRPSLLFIQPGSCRRYAPHPMHTYSHARSRNDYQTLYHGLVFSPASLAALLVASSTALSRAFFSFSIFMPMTAAAMPFCSSLRLDSHHVYIPIAASANPPTAQLAVVPTAVKPAIVRP